MIRVVFTGTPTHLEYRLDAPDHGLTDQPWTRIAPPLDPITLDDVRWYIEDFLQLPLGVDRARAARIQQQLRPIGHALYDKIFATRLAGQALERVIDAGGWLEIATEAGTPAAPLQWPWELLADERGFLAHRKLRIRRTVARPGIDSPPRDPSPRGLRVLLVVARPDGAGLVPYDSVDAALRAATGKPVRLDICPAGSLTALTRALDAALDEDHPYDVLHFDGHGDYDPHNGAILCFEAAPTHDRRLPIDPVTPTQLGPLLADKGIGLVLLDACRTATTHPEAPVSAGFAQALLLHDVPAVIAMGYTVHVDATALLCGAIYDALAAGRTIGEALSAARRALQATTRRRVGFGPLPERPAVDLHDWFVPQLYLATRADRRLLADDISASPATAPPRLPEAGPAAFPPPPPFGFVGRLRELHRLERALHHHPAARIWGLAGMGKTTLARQAAQWLLRTGRVEAAAFVSFEQSASAERATSQMSAALLGVQHAADRAAMIATFRSRPVLVVWDNLEVLSAPDMADEAAALDALYRQLTEDDGGPPPRGRLLLTSRDAAQHTSAWPVPLGGLWKPDARQLLDAVLQRRPQPATYAAIVHREGRAALPTGAREAQEHAGRQAIDALLDTLGHHPLSIELVGPSLATETAAAITAGLAEAIARAERGVGEEAERMQRLRGALDWSIARLGDEAREALPWLALFRGGVFEHCLLFVSALPAEQWQLARAELARTGLVRVDEAVEVNGRPYLGLHPTLALLSDEGRAADPMVQMRVVDVYAAVAVLLHQGLTGSGGAFRWALAVFTRAEANLRRALSWAEGDRASFLRSTMMHCLEAMGRQAAADRLGAQPVRGALGLRAQASIAFDRLATNPSSALTELAALADGAGEQPDIEPFDAALVFLYWGRALSSRGSETEAVTALRRAVTWLRDAVKARPDDSACSGNLSAALGDLGQSLQAIGDFDAAKVALRDGIAISQEHSDSYSEAVGWGQLASLAVDTGHYDDARAHYRRAVDIGNSLGDKSLVATNLQHMGSLESGLNRQLEAIQYYRMALDHYITSGDRTGAMQTRDMLGTAWQRRGDLITARGYFEAALRDAEVLGDRVQKAVTLHNLGMLEQYQAEAASAAGAEVTVAQHLVSAATHIEAALTLRQARGDRFGEASSWHHLGVIRKLQGRLPEARDALHTALTIHREFNHPDEWKDYPHLAEIHAALGEPEAAAAYRAHGETVKAHAAYNARRHTFLANLARLTAAARDRRGLAAIDAQLRDTLATLPGWLGALAGYFTALADATAPRPALPPGLPDVLRTTIEQVLAGADPLAALPPEARATFTPAPLAEPPPAPDTISLTRALCLAATAPEPPPQLDAILTAMAEAPDPTHRALAAHLTARRRGTPPPPLPPALAAVVAEHFPD